MRASGGTAPGVSGNPLAPHAGEPRLPLTRQAGGPVIVLDFDEAHARHISTPCFEIMENAVAAVAPAFLIRAARVGAEQHAAGLQRRVQLPQHALQRLTRDT